MDEIDKIIAEEGHVYDQKASFAQWLMYFGVGLIVALLPNFLYLSYMFGMSLSQHAGQIALVGVVCAALLAQGYNGIANEKKIQLLAKREVPRSGGGEARRALHKACAAEAGVFALAAGNATFLGLFLTSAFYLVPRVVSAAAPAPASHLLSCVGAAAALAWPR
ncbi:unnamed protein product, partial [Heterosigma akashiwo]